MIAKIHLVEGLPAVGKSTYSYRLQSMLSASGTPAIYFKEETCQPVDLFRQAVLTEEMYASLAEMPLSGAFRTALEQNSYSCGPHRIISYTSLPYDGETRNTVFPVLRAQDIGDGRVPFVRYRQLHLQIWEKFVNMTRDSCQYYITEGAFLHNQLLDILGFYDLSDAELLAYMQELLDIMAPLQPRVHYIYPSDVEHLVDSALSERGDQEGTWGYGFGKWLEFSSFGRKNQLYGRDGIVAVAQRMHEVSLSILENTGVEFELIERLV